MIVFDALTHRAVPWPHLRASTHAGDAVVAPFSAVGLHPERAGPDWRSDVDLVERALDAHCAVGEIGLDRRAHLKNLEHQLAAFDAQLQLANARALPIVLHAVRATSLVVERLRQTRVPIIWHAFSGPTELITQLDALDVRFSIGRLVLNPAAKRCREAAAKIPDDRLLIETDLEPHEDADIAVPNAVLDELARLRDSTRERLAVLCAENASLTLNRAVRPKSV